MGKYDTGFDWSRSTYTFETWEEYRRFQPPFHDLQYGEQIAIKGSKLVWTVVNTNLAHVHKICDKIHALAYLTVTEDGGFYGLVERSNIAYKIELDFDKLVA